MEKPLSGVRVLDLSTFVAAPVCCRLLADMGADVIKVERPEGDAWRLTGKGYRPDRFCDDENPVFDIYNSGKRHIALDLKTPEGKEVFFQLLEQADVFVTNTRPAALKRLGIAYEDLKDKFPGLIYGIVLGYGEEGPDKDKPAFDTVGYWSKSGFLLDMAQNNENYSPVLPPFGAGDTVTGYLLMGQICAALVRKNKTGKGDYVRSGLYHNGIFTMGTMQIITQKPWGREFPATRWDYSVPGGNYQCADGEWIYLAVGYAQALIPKFCQALDRPDLMDDPRFNSQEGRLANKKLCYETFRDAIAQKPLAHWLQKAEEFDLPIVRMQHFSDVSEDPQAWANDYLEQVSFRNGNVDIMPSSPIEMESLGKLKTTPAPAIGANTVEILRELGYSGEETEKLLRSGAAK